MSSWRRRRFGRLQSVTRRAIDVKRRGTLLTRSEQMSRIRSKNTKPEMLIRRGLHARGYRYRLHQKNLPGTPDVVLKKHGAVIEVRGCFWHGHDGCGRRPNTHQDFWNTKIDRNRERDRENERLLVQAGWRVLIVWECCMVGKGRWKPEALLDAVGAWLVSGKNFEEFEGQNGDRSGDQSVGDAC
ncbi:MULTISPECIES: very short patch repair endonuclease [Thioclava]|jgi:DNA mismatch endonuclease Vsr|uniref:very short patch repair endonuclease n=1 Tax=Thioclava TaxID=285107 RepID=UPI0009DCCF68|nr:MULTISPECIES: very short patch repair endonuclease [Thioclava]